EETQARPISTSAHPRPCWQWFRQSMAKTFLCLVLLRRRRSSRDNNLQTTLSSNDLLPFAPDAKPTSRLLCRSYKTPRAPCPSVRQRVPRPYRPDEIPRRVVNHEKSVAASLPPGTTVSDRREARQNPSSDRRTRCRRHRS